MRCPVRSTLRTSKFTNRPTSSVFLSKSASAPKKRPFTTLAPLPSELYGNERQPGRLSLETKKWRQSMFPAPAPASRREVELLGEWLNSVLAENLEQNDNPLDVCTNAQHWFSVAFNELVRQVAVECAERGRLFAVIWKRNQDLLTKLVQVQKEERQYILACHKERMQFLKTDLDFCQSRLSTIQGAYNEEEARWMSSHERDVTKFGSLQQKIDEQIQSRKELIKELNSLKEKLGLEIGDETPDDDPPERAHSYTYDNFVARAQELRWNMRLGKAELLDMANEMDDISHFLDMKQKDTLDLRTQFEDLFLSLPSDAKPTLRNGKWLVAAISYVFSHYIAFLASSNVDEDEKMKPFKYIVYEILLDVYGTRLETEQVLFDLFYTVKASLELGIGRITHFARFVGMMDPMPMRTIHFYMHALTIIKKSNPGPMFPEAEAGGESLLSGIPSQVAVTVSTGIIEMLATGKSLKIYRERINKIANDGMMRFGGKAIAELDQCLDYILTVYNEECDKLTEVLKDQWEKLPGKVIRSFSQFENMMSHLKHKPDRDILPGLFQNALMEESTKTMDLDLFMKVVNESGLNLPMILSSSDFLPWQTAEDVSKFMQFELESHLPLYNELMKQLSESGDEIMIKQLKSARTRFEQALNSRSLGRTFQSIQREFYERMFLLKHKP